ncbi:MAG: cysteine--tRNA ligase [Rhodoferax sp.]|nr:cysteine--tRNA ligase [Rhodoferax sp.]
MSLRIYNTLSRGMEDFVSLEPGRVRMYVCGMTIYDLCHVGHARMMMAFDVISRWLAASGYEVNYVRNITDIDDKIIKRAVERNMPIRVLTDQMIQAMHQDLASLGIAQPTSEPRATEHVGAMTAMIGTLQTRGLAYQAPNGDMNFSVRKFPGYGKLSGRSLDQLRAGERIAVADGKEDPLDFVLWKAAKPDEPVDAKFESPFGVGRPGWHIECSAMSCALLGTTFDIHGGGADLQFPHHENEIAQSEGANGQPLAKYWIHNGFLQVDNEKMSKSLGNFFTIRDVLKDYDGETVRFFMLRVHYRRPFNYSDAGLDDARAGLKRLYTALQAVPPEPATIDWTNPFAKRFRDAMDNDFSTPEAVATLFDLATEINRGKSASLSGLLRGLGACLGLLQGDPDVYLKAGARLDDAAIAALIGQRAAAKAARNFSESDRIRDQLLAHGIVLKDTSAGTTWEAQA